MNVSFDRATSFTSVFPPTSPIVNSITCSSLPSSTFSPYAQIINDTFSPPFADHSRLQAHQISKQENPQLAFLSSFFPANYPALQSVGKSAPAVELFNQSLQQIQNLKQQLPYLEQNGFFEREALSGLKKDFCSVKYPLSCIACDQSQDESIKKGRLQKGKNQLIPTAFPLGAAIEPFWQEILDQRVSFICNLTPTSRVPSYWPSLEEKWEVGALVVECLQEKVPFPQFKERVFRLHRGFSTSLITMLHYEGEGWPYLSAITLHYIKDYIEGKLQLDPYFQARLHGFGDLDAISQIISAIAISQRLFERHAQGLAGDIDLYFLKELFDELHPKSSSSIHCGAWQRELVLAVIEMDLKRAIDNLKDERSLNQSKLEAKPEVFSLNDFTREGPDLLLAHYLLKSLELTDSQALNSLQTEGDLLLYQRLNGETLENKCGYYLQKKKRAIALPSYFKQSPTLRHLVRALKEAIEEDHESEQKKALSLDNDCLTPTLIDPDWAPYLSFFELTLITSDGRQRVFNLAVDEIGQQTFWEEENREGWNSYPGTVDELALYLKSKEEFFLSSPISKPSPLGNFFAQRASALASIATKKEMASPVRQKLKETAPLLNAPQANFSQENWNQGNWNQEKWIQENLLQQKEMTTEAPRDSSQTLYRSWQGR